MPDNPTATPAGAAGRRRQTPLQLVRAIRLSRNWLLISISLLIGTVMAVLAIVTESDLRDVFIALSTSLIASSIVGMLQIFLTASELEHVITETIGAELEHRFDQARARDSAFGPVRVFDRATTYHPDFNLAVADALRSNGNYTFSGVTGRYAVARLRSERVRPRDVRLIIADPSNEAAIEERVTHLATANGGGDRASIRRQVTSEIYQAIVGARAIAPQCESLTIHLSSTAPIDRVELFDHTAFLTLFSDRHPQDDFPRTLQFDRGSFGFQVAETMVKERRASAPLIVDAKQHNIDQFIDFMVTTLHDEAFSLTTWEAYASQFEDFAEQFTDDLARMQVAG